MYLLAWGLLFFTLLTDKPTPPFVLVQPTPLLRARWRKPTADIASIVRPVRVGRHGMTEAIVAFLARPPFAIRT